MIFFLSGLLLFVSACGAQTVTDRNAHAWLVYAGDHAMSNRWGVHLEGQFRRHDLFNSWQQLLLRPALNFSVNRAVMLSAGYAYVRTHRYGGHPVAARFPEHRFYQQLLVRHKTGRIDWQQRERVEQRWLNPGAWRRQDRFRHMTRAAIPLSRAHPAGVYVFLQDEIFLNFGSNYGARVFDQNRAVAGIGKPLGRIGRLEFGYMNQFLAQRSGRVFEANHTALVWFTSSLPLRAFVSRR